MLNPDGELELSEPIRIVTPFVYSSKTEVSLGPTWEPSGNKSTTMPLILSVFVIFTQRLHDRPASLHVSLV